jgi:multidrug efflux pump subunit AcrA (membrane-fusion protein)
MLDRRTEDAMAHSMTVMHQTSERGDVTSKDWRAGRRPGGRVWIFVALAIAVLAVAAGAQLLRGMGPVSHAATIGQMAQQPVLAVTVAPAEIRPMIRSVSGNGSVVAWQELAIAAEVSGLRVVDIAVDEGDRVRRGQLLVRFDDAMLAAQLAQVEAAIAEGEAALQTARSDFSRGTELLRGGSIASQVVEQRQSAARLGAVSAEGLEMFRLVRDGRLELDAKVPELDLAAIHPGLVARVVHGDWQVQATVRAVAPMVATDTRFGVVHIALAADSPLRAGMFARAEILIDAAPTLAVPQAAIVYRDDAPAAFVQNADNNVSLRRLTTGARRDGFVGVLGGLRPGELVVTSGAGFLSDGDSVRVVAPLAIAAH